MIFTVFNPTYMCIVLFCSYKTSYNCSSQNNTRKYYQSSCNHISLLQTALCGTIIRWPGECEYYLVTCLDSHSKGLCGLIHKILRKYAVLEKLENVFNVLFMQFYSMSRYLENSDSSEGKHVSLSK